MCEFAGKKAIGLKPGATEISYEHSCGVIDEREARAMIHLILAEVRRSNAPDWVALELEKKLECHECYRHECYRTLG
jgi:hypothetical protein